ncbi:MAG: hypothetical protein HS116_08630 [Planctomycetes bacterium]|nr:hypothetical protein [Planctomycetota bacterium]
MKRRCSLAALVLALLALSSPYFPSFANPEPPPPSPVSLSNPDGQEMDLLRYDLRLAVHGPLALTEMEMVFRNPQDRQMEGRFQYLLPPGATLSRFAKEVDGKLMEGEVVETKRARAVYRQILHTLRDPALLEQDQGNRFSAKVFPIPAKGTVRLLLGYSQCLPLKNDKRKLTIPMAGMPVIQDFSFSAVIRAGFGSGLHPGSTHGFAVATEQAGTIQILSKRQANYKPERDLVLEFQGSDGGPKAQALRAGNFELLSYRPSLAWKEGLAAPRDQVWYFDTSASNADTHERRMEAVEKLLKAVQGSYDTLDAYAFDLDVAHLTTYTDPAKGNNGTPKSIPWCLRQRHALGATDLARALKHACDLAKTKAAPAQFVFVTDGIATWGATEAGEVLKAVEGWPERSSLSVLVLGAKQDATFLNALVEKTGGRVAVASLGEALDKELQQALSEIARPLGATFEFYSEGTAWLYPKRFRDVQPGDELLVFAQLEAGAAPKLGVIKRDTRGGVERDEAFTQAPAEAPGFAPLLEREAYRACLAHLEAQERDTSDAAKKEALRKERIEISVKHRVLCSLTSLLVLETENDYARFGIDRKALAGIMTVGPMGIQALARTEADLALRPAPKPAEPKPAAKQGGARLEQEALARSEAKSDDARPTALSAGEADGELADLDKSIGNAEGGYSDIHDPAGPGRDTGGTSSGGGANHFAAPQGGTPAQSPPPATNAPERTREVAQAAAPADAPSARPAEQDAASNPALVAPAWTQQAQRKIGEGDLKGLLAKVQANPLDRMARNSLAEARVKLADWDALLADAFEWLPLDPENPQVFEHLASASAKLGAPEQALRAVTSVAEVAPRNSAYLERAGWLLLVAGQRAHAETLFRRAIAERDDHANGFRGLALSLWLAGKHEAAAEVLEAALGKTFDGRYGDAARVLREELAYVYRAWIAADPAAFKTVPERAKRNKVSLDKWDALRVTLAWETDANDVDLHVVDPKGEECFYSHTQTASGLSLYSDQTQGLGPEVIRTGKLLPGAYQVGVKYYNPGPMGVSRGVVVVYRPDPSGLVAQPQIAPFCLVPQGEDIRHLLEISAAPQANAQVPKPAR